jgi:predicted phosphoribosyltransferase
MVMSFQNRTDAGRRLAALLTEYAPADPVIVALPRGGVPVAVEIAAALNAPLDIILVRKVGVPQQPELAAGAVVDGDPPVLVRNEGVIAALRLSEDVLQRVVSAELAEIERRRRVYLRERGHLPLEGRTVIVVDDGVATGATIRAALRAIRLARPRRVVLAVPVGPSDTIAALRGEADEVVCAEEHDFFDAIGNYYVEFHQLTDAEVTALLDAAAARVTPPR